VAANVAGSRFTDTSLPASGVWWYRVRTLLKGQQSGPTAPQAAYLRLVREAARLPRIRFE
jgi:hypothetical protein